MQWHRLEFAFAKPSLPWVGGWLGLAAWAVSAPGATNDPGASTPSGTNAARIIVASDRVFTWRDVTSLEYPRYIENLRAVGCPEEHVRHIVLRDVTALFDARRLEEAIKRDPPWWRAGAPRWTQYSIRATPPFEHQRELLLNRLLGSNWQAAVKLPTISPGLNFNLTGPVLGAMPLERFSAAAEICERARERLQQYQMSRFNEGHQPDPVEEARLRAQTRQEMSQLLTAAEMEEFLLRNSHNAESLRQRLRGFSPTPEEFRAIFRALDPLQHQMQLDYGSPAALSPRQREEFERQCDRAVQEVLPPERFQAYLRTKDPDFQRAQATAQHYGLADEAVAPLAEFYRAQRARQEEITRDAQRTDQQRQHALQDLAREEQRKIQELLQGQTGDR